MGNLPSITICGCGSGGMATAADLAMMGCRVNLYETPHFKANLEPIRADGGITLTGLPLSGKTGLAQHQAALTLPNVADGNQIMHQLLVEDVLAAPDIAPVKGRLSAAVASRPGLGFDLNWDAVGRATELCYRDERYRHS